MNDDIARALIRQLEAVRLEVRAFAEGYMSGKSVTGYQEISIKGYRDRANAAAKDANELAKPR